MHRGLTCSRRQNKRVGAKVGGRRARVARENSEGSENRHPGREVLAVEQSLGDKNNGSNVMQKKLNACAGWWRGRKRLERGGVVDLAGKGERRERAKSNATRAHRALGGVYSNLVSTGIISDGGVIICRWSASSGSLRLS